MIRSFTVVVLCCLGCGGPRATPDAIWGERGVLDGQFVRPRAIAIDGDDLFIVDFTPRIQRFDLNGKYLGVSFQPPDFRNGRPSGLSFNRDGHLIVSDSHYHMIRIYDREGHELQAFGGNAGSEPGKFGYISDAVQDEDGNYYLSEFNTNERITKLDRDGKFIKTWGRPGPGPGEFNRPRALALSPDGLLYVADACNHRIQVFSRDGEFIRMFGSPGSQPGKLQYPYDVAFSPSGRLFVVEYGNQRVQWFTPDGQSLGTWGRAGRRPGELANPWAIAVDRLNRVFIVDTENHRVQRIAF